MLISASTSVFLNSTAALRRRIFAFVTFFGIAGWTRLLVDQHALDDLGVVDRAADLLLDLDVVGVDGPVLVGNHRDRLDREVAEHILCGLCSLSGHRGLGDLLEHRDVPWLDSDRDLLQDLLGLLGRHAVPVGDHGRVDVLLEEVFRTLQEFSGDNDRGGRPVADFVVLGLRDLDHHLCGRVLDVHLFQDGHAVVGDDDIADRVDEHLVHSLRTESRPYCICNGLGRSDVHALGITPAGA